MISKVFSLSLGRLLGIQVTQALHLILVLGYK